MFEKFLEGSKNTKCHRVNSIVELQNKYLARMTKQIGIGWRGVGAVGVLSHLYSREQVMLSRERLSLICTGAI